MLPQPQSSYPDPNISNPGGLRGKESLILGFGAGIHAASKTQVSKAMEHGVRAQLPC